MTKPLTGVRADRGFGYQDLEKCAVYVRDQLKFAADAAVDALSLFEDLHEIAIKQADGKKIPLRAGVIAIEDSEGYTRYDSKLNVIEVLASEITYDRLEAGHPRAAYFVAHELGHCILHTDRLVRLSQMPINQQAHFHRGLVGHKPFEDTEWQANAFASALLMPARGLAALQQRYGALTRLLIAEKFCVSKEAAGYRLDLFEARRNDLLI